jgi:TolB-like protein/Tfp pilus assembly protein PilF
MVQSSRGYQRLFAEMKRRHVFRVAAIYGAVAFAILQVAEPLATALSLPDYFLSLVVGLLLLGFPVAIVLAWAFEVTPDGVQKAEPAAPEEIEAIVAQPAAKRWVSGLLALAGIVALVVGSAWVGRQTASGPELKLGVPAARAADFVKVAVLPFETVGSEDDDFAFGIHMDLQQQLGQLSALRVTSPMSVREYRTTEKGDREIAGELDVAYLLRGTLRRSGTMARVDVLLVDAESGENVWSEQYDQELTPDNLFDIQSGIALEVARNLARELSPADLAMLEEEPPTNDLAALAAFGQARDAYFTPGAGETIADAVALASRAVELDPDFAEAWALLARMLSYQAYLGEPTGDSSLSAVETVEALVPGSLHAITARAFYTYYVEWRLEEALEQLGEAERLSPSDSEVQEVIADLNRRLGRWNAALSRIRRAIELNPKSPMLLYDYSVMLKHLGRYAAADEVMERALQLGPSIPPIRAGKVLSTYERTGDAERALRLAAELGLEISEPVEGRALIELAALSGDLDEAARMIDELPRRESRVGELSRLWLRAQASTLMGRDTRALGDSILALDLRSTGESWDEMLEFTAHAFRGDTARAWPLLDEAIRIARSNDDVRTRATQFSNAAYFSVLFGRPEHALEFLDEGVEMPGFGLSAVQLEDDPGFESVRDDPRFQEILERRRAFEEQAARDAEADRPWLP